MYITTGSYNDPSGQAMSQLGSLGGAAIGNMIFPGVGGAVGGALGGSLGGLFGGGKKKQKQQIFPIGTKENPGFIPLQGGGSQIFNPAGIGDQTTSAGSQALGGALQGLGIGDQLGGMMSQNSASGQSGALAELRRLMQKFSLGGGGGAGTDSPFVTDTLGGSAASLTNTGGSMFGMDPSQFLSF